MAERETWYRARFVDERVRFDSIERDGSVGLFMFFGYHRTKPEAAERLRDELRQKHRELQEQATRLSRLAALADEQALTLRMADIEEVSDD